MVACFHKAYGFVICILVLLAGCVDSHCEEVGLISRQKSQTDTIVCVKKDSVDIHKKFYSVDNNLSYNLMKKLIITSQVELRQREFNLDSIGPVFCNYLVYKLFPYWYGTRWDFNGYTAIPKEGSIACGYFVSTTLLHMGINVNRFKLAQQLPIYEAMSIALSEEILIVEANTTSEIIQRTDLLLENGLYFVGFDQSHVGYFLKDDDGMFVIHSNYIGAEGVVPEQVEYSEAFASYTRFYYASISNNESLMRAWLSGEEVKVVED